MTTKKTITLNSLENQFEKDILLFLKDRGECIYGEIIKDLQISSARGQEAIYSLINQGYIKHMDRTSRLKLNIDLKE